LRVLDDTRSYRYREAVTLAWLRPRWLGGDLLCEIAQDAGCSVATIRRYGARFGFPARPPRRGEQGWGEVLTPEYLQAAYVEGQMSAEAIAAEVGTTASTVSRWLAACGIPRRGHRPGVDNVLYDERLTPEFLSLRLSEHASVKDIAREVGCSNTAVRGALTRCGLGEAIEGIRPPRPPCAPASELRHLYEAGLSLDAIAGRLGVSRTKVRADLSRFGIRPYARPGFRATDGTWTDEEAGLPKSNKGAGRPC
jgi:transposase-like protein